ncbi:MAG: hypothetical protein SXU28_04510 [Pseudomonadota bacterium]|nr:hypothetical protein [Pseudomonadota bacterium]
MDDAHKGRSGRSALDDIIYNLETQQRSLDQMGLMKAAAHLDASLVQLRKDADAASETGLLRKVEPHDRLATPSGRYRKPRISLI